MNTQFFRQRHNVVAFAEAIDRHSAECRRISSNASLSHLQLLSLQRVPFESVAELGFTPAGIGAFGLSLLAIAADQIASIKRVMVFYKPTGPLSGVTTSALLIWLVVWAILNARWRDRNVALPRVITAAFLLLGLAFLLTFPPIADLF